MVATFLSVMHSGTSTYGETRFRVQGRAGAGGLTETRLFLGRESPSGTCHTGSQRHIPK